MRRSSSPMQPPQMCLGRSFRTGEWDEPGAFVSNRRMGYMPAASNGNTPAASMCVGPLGRSCKPVRSFLPLATQHCWQHGCPSCPCRQESGAPVWRSLQSRVYGEQATASDLNSGSAAVKAAIKASGERCTAPAVDQVRLPEPPETRTATLSESIRRCLATNEASSSCCAWNLVTRPAAGLTSDMCQTAPPDARAQCVWLLCVTADVHTGRSKCLGKDVSSRY